jgi:hypothetical protein
MSNLPEDPEQVIDLVAKSQYLKVNTELGEIKLEAHNQINIQPKGTPLGMKLKLEETGDITPTITFDTKKLREPAKKINPSEIVDNAIEEYLNDQEI